MRPAQYYKHEEYFQEPSNELADSDREEFKTWNWQQLSDSQR
jgi:hypothetical protein